MYHDFQKVPLAKKPIHSPQKTILLLDVLFPSPQKAISLKPCSPGGIDSLLSIKKMSGSSQSQNSDIPTTTQENSVSSDENVSIKFHNPTHMNEYSLEIHSNAVENNAEDKFSGSEDRFSDMEFPKLSEVLPQYKESYSKIEEHWRIDDDKLLSKLAMDMKLDWKKISKKYCAMTSKKVTPQYLKLRYKQIKPQYTKKSQSLTQEDDCDIIRLFDQYGDDWEQISKNLSNMDPIKIRNRFYSQILKRKNFYEELTNIKLDLK
mmetsp:Transcript_35429/g.31916  ORF Transcript_35429/g.31916 Transcript_35429/m.31916 type:complete len:262 (-) Transcript_35429:625-1410(-)